jgi:hypothetical protein
MLHGPIAVAAILLDAGVLLALSVNFWSQHGLREVVGQSLPLPLHLPLCLHVV